MTLISVNVRIHDFLESFSLAFPSSPPRLATSFPSASRRFQGAWLVARRPADDVAALPSQVSPRRPGRTVASALFCPRLGNSGGVSGARSARVTRAAPSHGPPADPVVRYGDGDVDAITFGEWQCVLQTDEYRACNPVVVTQTRLRRGQSKTCLRHAARAPTAHPLVRGRGASPE